jgi:hypothetical protein
LIFTGKENGGFSYFWIIALSFQVIIKERDLDIILVPVRSIAVESNIAQ